MIASPSAWALGSLPSVSIVNEIATGIPAAIAARVDAERLLDVGHRDRRDHVRGGLGKGPDLLGVVLLRLVRGHLSGRVVAVVLRTDTAADHDRRAILAGLGAKLLHQLDRLAVELRQLLVGVADLRRPVRIRTPGGAFEHEPEAVLARQGHIWLEVGPQLALARIVLEQVECSELGQVEPAVEDQVGLEAAVG